MCIVITAEMLLRFLFIIILVNFCCSVSAIFILSLILYCRFFSKLKYTTGKYVHWIVKIFCTLRSIYRHFYLLTFDLSIRILYFDDNKYYLFYFIICWVNNFCYLLLHLWSSLLVTTCSRFNMKLLFIFYFRHKYLSLHNIIS